MENIKNKQKEVYIDLTGKQLQAMISGVMKDVVVIKELKLFGMFDLVLVEYWMWGNDVGLKNRYWSDISFYNYRITKWISRGNLVYKYQNHNFLHKDLKGWLVSFGNGGENK